MCKASVPVCTSKSHFRKEKVFLLSNLLLVGIFPLAWIYFSFFFFLLSRQKAPLGLAVGILLLLINGTLHMLQCVFYSVYHANLLLRLLLPSANMVIITSSVIDGCQWLLLIKSCEVAAKKSRMCLFLQNTSKKKVCLIMYFMALHKAVFLHLQMSVFSQTSVALQLF